AAAARPGDVLVSAMVRDLATDGGLAFAERGACALAGLSEPVRLLVASLRDDLAEAARSGRADLAALSPREREIVGFLARGMTNGGIATELALSEHTVKRHVANILLKLDLPTRSAAAALVAGQR
ncbi:MAG TPA: helix-turn-helix transcriptional regulator, partial [Acetobacteraceae bacterium]|nr:helix-turn-helix transcriptional regulator [Acetobacteraceae bacterium]